MIPSFLQKQNTRRGMLRNCAGFAGSALLAQLFPASLLNAGVPALCQQAATPPTDSLGAMRAQMGTVPIHSQPLAENLAGLGNAPLKTVIDTHWHVDHTDNNANLHAAGATVLAHDNTKTRMAEPHDSALMGLHFPASPADALPQQTFSSSKELHANGEIVMLQYFQPAHTDTDIYIHFQKANVIHMGDTFFNGFYPVIDASTGGKINGMILAANKILTLVDNNTKIVPGHGPLGNKADLTKFRDMLVVARDRVQKLKNAGKSAGEIAASKPFADLDATWGKGFFNGDVFAQVVYSAL